MLIVNKQGKDEIEGKVEVICLAKCFTELKYTLWTFMEPSDNHMSELGCRRKPFYYICIYIHSYVYVASSPLKECIESMLC